MSRERAGQADGAVDDEVPDRSIGAVNADDTVLPVIGEAAESSSQLSHNV